MFVRLSRLVLQKLNQHSERAVTWRCFCSSVKCATNSEDQSGLNKKALENTKVPKQHKKLYWERKVDKFMSNLSEEHLLLKKQLDIEIELMRQMNVSVPNEISPTDWMILLTECKSWLKKKKYIEYLYKKEYHRLRALKTKERIRIEAKLMRTADFDIGSIYYGMSRGKQINKWNSVKALRSDIDVIIDLGFDICTQAQRCVYSNLELLLAENRNHVQPLKIHVTNAEKNYRLTSVMNSHEEAYAFLYKDNFLDVFPHKDLVYLSPDGPPMNEFNPNFTYVIGGIGDFNDEIGMTLKFAIDNGLRCASFPIKEYFCGPKTSNLRMQHAYGILLDMYLHNSWKEAFIKHLPSVYTLRQDVVTLNDLTQRMRWTSKADPYKVISILNGLSKM